MREMLSGETHKKEKQRKVPAEPAESRSDFDQVGERIARLNRVVSRGETSTRQSLAEYGKIRRKLGLPQSTDLPPAQLQDLRVLETLKSKGGDLESSSETYIHPTASYVENGRPGTGFENWAYKKFTPEQRIEIESHKTSFDGHTFRVGDRVLVSGSIYTVESIEPHPGHSSKIVQKEHPASNEFIEEVVPTVLELRSDSFNETWRAIEGHDLVEPAVGLQKDRAIQNDATLAGQVGQAISKES
jgi:hypothetical protein